MSRSLWLALSLAAALCGACGGDDDDDDGAGDADADTDADSDADGDGDTDADGDADVACALSDETPAAYDVTFDPDPGLEVVAASPKLGLWWFQLSDDGPDPPPAMGLLADPSPVEGSLEVTVDERPGDCELVCTRPCDDEVSCACTSTNGLGMAFVILWDDEDGDDMYDDDEPLLGFAEGHAVVWLQDDLSPPYDDEVETWMSDKLESETLGQGLHLVEIVRDGEIFDHFRPADAGAVILVREAANPDAYAFPNLT